MKSLSFGYKILFFINNIFALLLLFAYTTTFLSPVSFPFFAIINFSIPVLWFINLGFVLVWLLKLKKHIFLSLIVIALGWFHFQKLFVISESEKVNEPGLKVMSYNVMQFYNKENKKISTYPEIEKFINNENPDIICLQEFKNQKHPVLENYAYNTLNKSSYSLQSVILSRHKILNHRVFNFEKSGNSAVFADIIFKADTVRVFSTHFQSLNVKPDFNEIKDEPKDKLFKRLENTFKQQISQFNTIKDFIKNSPYPVIFGADMNNTPLSFLYQRVIDQNLKDTFLESGKFYGNTFNFSFLPVRIDMIFIDERLQSSDFKNYNLNYSDHFPIMTEIHF